MIKWPSLVAALLLAGCGGSVYPIQYERALQLCAPHGGLTVVRKASVSMSRNGHTTYVEFEAVCANGSVFSNTFTVAQR